MAEPMRSLLLLSAILLAQQPGPEPRTVVPIPSPGKDADGSPKGIPDYGRFRLYTVEVFVDGQVVATPGVDDHRDLDELLKMYALRFAFVKKAEVRIKRHNVGGEDWFHPGGKPLPEHGRLPLVTTVNVGSYRIE